MCGRRFACAYPNFQARFPLVFLAVIVQVDMNEFVHDFCLSVVDFKSILALEVETYNGFKQANRQAGDQT